MEKAAVGIVTYNRPSQFEVVAEAAIRHFDVPIFAHNDGSPQVEKYAALRKKFDGSLDLFNAPENHGVGYSKNRLLARMLRSGADGLFVLEVIPQSPDAITTYVEGWGIGHPSGRLRAAG